MKYGKILFNGFMLIAFLSVSSFAQNKYMMQKDNMMS